MSVRSEGNDLHEVFMMQRQLKEKFPKWVESVMSAVLVLSNDLDSLLSCKLLEVLKGYRINYFYTFESIHNCGQRKGNPVIGVDVSLTKGMAWDNHVVMLSKDDKFNGQSANINVINRISTENYTSKYAGSTALMIWSYYNLPLPKTEEGKMLLLSIDSAYLGHYYGSRIKKVHNSYMKQLGFEELIDIMERKTIEDFDLLKSKYKSDEEITIDENGYLHTSIDLKSIGEILGIDLSLPNMKFKKKHKLQSTEKPQPITAKTTEEYEIRLTKHLKKKYSVTDDNSYLEIFSIAVTHKNKFKYTYRAKKSKSKTALR